MERDNTNLSAVAPQMAESYLVQMWDELNRRWETQANPPEEGLFPSYEEASDWIDENIEYLRGETSRANYRILPLEIGKPFCESCGHDPHCSHHIIIPGRIKEFGRGGEVNSEAMRLQ
jgi:hypothetical protein